MAKSNWIIIELSEQAETVGYPELEAAIRMVFGAAAEFFIPMHHEQMGSYVSTNTLFDGYVFVKDTEDARSKFINIRESRFLAGPLRMSGKLRTISSYQVSALRKKLSNSLKKKYKEGKRVLITEGIFQNLEGVILSMSSDGRIANVQVKCLSREMIAPIPTTCIKEIVG